MSESTLRHRGPKPATPQKATRPQSKAKVDYEESIFRQLLTFFGGFIFLNFLLSYFVTGGATWGYETKLTNPSYLKHLTLHRQFGLAPYPVFTEAELAIYDGADIHKEDVENKPYSILLALNGTVYDVSSNPGSYGPIGPYHIFAGRDAARAFITGCFRSPDHLTHDFRGLDPEFAEETVSGWQKFFGGSSHYWKVGTLKHTHDYNSLPETFEEFEALKKDGVIAQSVEWTDVPKPCGNARGQKPGFRESFVHHGGKAEEKGHQHH